MKIFLNVLILMLAIAATDSAALSLEISRLAKQGTPVTEVEQQNRNSSEDSQECDSEDGKIICP